MSVQLEKALKNSYDLDVEVINAAMGGFTAYQELVALIYHVYYMDPDMVIVIDGNNELGVFEGKLPHVSAVC